MNHEQLCKKVASMPVESQEALARKCQEIVMETGSNLYFQEIVRFSEEHVKLQLIIKELTEGPIMAMVRSMSDCEVTPEMLGKLLIHTGVAALCCHEVDRAVREAVGVPQGEAEVPRFDVNLSRLNGLN